MVTRTGSRARNEIVDMLKADHRKVKRAFSDFEKLNAEEDLEQCQMLVERTCAELEVHAQLEEELFYPAVRDAIREPDLIDEAEIEHQSAKMLIDQIKKLDMDDPKYAASFKVLGEYVKHHIREEENELFEQLGRAKVDWDAMLEQMMERRVALMKELGLPAEEEETAMAGAEEDEDGERGARGSGRRTRRTPVAQ